MKCTIPEISWHNRDPVLSVDIQPGTNEDFYRLASGGTDSHVLIWHLRILASGATSIEPVSDLTRHQKAVNVVRWSPSGQYLASGDDDANIIIWHQKADDLAIMLDGDNNDKEKWSILKVLRGHKEDVYDICWSPDSKKLLSGSVDNTAMIWDLTKGLNDNILKDHKGFVQGVTWDPLGQFVATLCSDRICRVFTETGKQVKARMTKGLIPVSETHSLHGQMVRYYHDDTLKSFFRRLTFSPDGNLIITPAGYLEMGPNNKNLYTSYIFTIASLTQPVAILPSPGQYTIAARCCPILFKLHSDGPDPVVSLPYRMIIAIATRSSVILYDTQQMIPFAIISNIHYTRLTDLTWSSNGRLLAVSSTDGFCSLVTFEVNELGEEYVKEKEVVEQDIPESLNETSEEIMDTSLNVSVEEKKEKKPSFLEQWTKKMKTGNEEKSSTKMEVDDDVIIIEPENEKENVIKNNETKQEQSKPEDKSSTFAKSQLNPSPAKLIAVRRKPRNDQHNMKIDDSKQTQAKSESIDVVKPPSNSSPAKPIAVRRKPRSNQQMNITQFLKSPKTVSSPINKAKEESKPVPFVNIPEDSLARPPWNSEEKQQVNNIDTQEVDDDIIMENEDTSTQAPIKLMIEDDSQDIILVLEDTVTDIIDISTAVSASEKMEIIEKSPICSNSEQKDSEETNSNKLKPNETIETSTHINHKSESKDSKCDKNKTIDQKRSDSKEVESNSSTDSHKLRVPLITLSSPKHKKKLV